MQIFASAKIVLKAWLSSRIVPTGNLGEKHHVCVFIAAATSCFQSTKHHTDLPPRNNFDIPPLVSVSRTAQVSMSKVNYTAAHACSQQSKRTASRPNRHISPQAHTTSHSELQVSSPNGDACLVYDTGDERRVEILEVTRGWHKDVQSHTEFMKMALETLAHLQARSNSWLYTEAEPSSQKGVKTHKPIKQIQIQIVMGTRTNHGKMFSKH